MKVLSSGFWVLGFKFWVLCLGLGTNLRGLVGFGRSTWSRVNARPCPPASALFLRALAEVFFFLIFYFKLYIYQNLERNFDDVYLFDICTCVNGCEVM